MKKFIYKFALFVSVVAFVSSLLGGVSIVTSIARSGLVYLGTLLIVIISLNILRWSMARTVDVSPPEVQQKK